MEGYLSLFARLALGAVFLTAGLGKWLDRGSVGEGTLEYRLLPRGWARLHGRVLPWVEMATGLLLLLGPLVPLGSLLRALPLLLAVGVLVIFSVAVAIALARGWDVDCRCFGRFGSDARVTNWSLWRNLILLALAATALWGERYASPAVGGQLFSVVPVLLLDLAALAITAMAAEALALRGAAHRQ